MYLNPSSPSSAPIGEGTKGIGANKDEKPEHKNRVWESRQCYELEWAKGVAREVVRGGLSLSGPIRGGTPHLSFE